MTICIWFVRLMPLDNNRWCNEILVLATLSGLALMGCASVQQAPNTQETIRYASSPCFGACPIYSVEVTPTGLICFEGKQYTKAIGVKEIQGSVKIIKSLLMN